MNEFVSLVHTARRLFLSLREGRKWDLKLAWKGFVYTYCAYTRGHRKQGWCGRGTWGRGCQAQWRTQVSPWHEEREVGGVWYAHSMKTNRQNKTATPNWTRTFQTKQSHVKLADIYKAYFCRHWRAQKLKISHTLVIVKPIGHGLFTLKIHSRGWTSHHKISSPNF